LQLFIIVKGNLCLPSKAQIAHEILAYLAEHPDAQDTFEGIVQWWLLERKIQKQATLVAEVIEDLVTKGFLLMEQNATHSKSRYRLNPRKK